MTHTQLQGRWLATLEGQTTAVLLELGPHPELAESVRGTAVRAGRTVLVSGDVDHGELTLEESDNGTSISATWLGTVVEGRCGKEIRGSWTPASATTGTPFVMNKQAGQWQ